jgi:transcriptional regulator with XRE-family HTH domain
MIMNLKSLLADVGLTQAEFATISGMSRVTIGKWCNNKAKPNKHVADHIDDIIERLLTLHKARRLPDRPLTADERAAALLKLFPPTR